MRQYNIRTIETTDGLYINLKDVLRLLTRVFRGTFDLTVLKVRDALKDGELADDK
jgi:hypothetical protein